MPGPNFSTNEAPQAPAPTQTPPEQSKPEASAPPQQEQAQTQPPAPPEIPKPKIVDVMDDENAAAKAPLTLEKTFTYEWQSPVSGKLYKGTFTCLLLLNQEQKRVWGVEYARLTGGEKVDGYTGMLIDAWALLQKDAALLAHPPWWNRKEVLDDEVVFHLYEKVRAAQNSFREAALAKRR